MVELAGVTGVIEVIKSPARRGKLDGVRTVLLAVSVGALGAVVAGCGGSS
jgi:hypothetical protein